MSASSTSKRKRRRRSSNRLYRAICVILAVVVIGAAGFWMYRQVSAQKSLNVDIGNQVDVGIGYRQIEYSGKKYRYNDRITTIVYAGLDAEGALEVSSTYTTAPRADSISVVVMDDYHKRMSIIALSRDTMTEIHKYTLNGRDRGPFVDHLGYAYTYGEGGRVSGMNLCKAISDLLGGVPVHNYVVSSRGSIPMIADVIGPVEVVVPNDDLSARGFSKGETVVIDGSNLETFVRSRDTGEDLSNTGRMERQRAYIEAAIGKLTDYITSKPSNAWDTMLRAEGCVQTNITRNHYLDLTKTLQNTAFGEGAYYIPEGRNVVGEDHDEFYPDAEKIRALAVDLFYIEQ